jgi:hypothetical protein
MQFYSFFFFPFCPHNKGLPPFLSFFLFLISHCKHAESHYTVSHFLLFSNFVVSVRHCFTRVFIFCQCRLATPSLAPAIVSLEKTRLPPEHIWFGVGTKRSETVSPSQSFGYRRRPL